MINKLMKGFKKNNKGFTLVELMVVVVIIGILVAIAVPVYNASQGKANRNTVAANLRIIDGAIMEHQINNQGTAPTAGESSNLVGDYLQAWPTKPTGATYSISATKPYRAEVTIATGFTGIATGSYNLSTLPE